MTAVMTGPENRKTKGPHSRPLFVRQGLPDQDIALMAAARRFSAAKRVLMHDTLIRDRVDTALRYLKLCLGGLLSAGGIAFFTF